MVEMKKRGELRDKLEGRRRDELKELCYILDLAKSGNKDELIDRIVHSEFDIPIIDQKARFLLFGLDLKDYFSAKQLQGILIELGLRTHSTKWDNVVEIVKSELVKPSELLGMLSTTEMDRFFSNILNGEPPSNRSDAIQKIIKVFNVGWMEEGASKGFIIMAMKQDLELDSVLRIIKNVCEHFDIKAIRIDDIQNSHEITEEVIREIEQANYLFVDLTYERPNVYYELGYAHGKGKDPKYIVLMAKSETPLHFDTRNKRTIFWKNPENLEKQLRKRLSSIVSSERF